MILQIAITIASGGNHHESLHVHPAFLLSAEATTSTSHASSCGPPEFSITLLAYSTLSIRGICAERRSCAAACVKLSRIISLFICNSRELSDEVEEVGVSVIVKLGLKTRGTDQYMTTTKPTHRHSPASTNNGTSRTQTLSPLHQHRTTSLSIARRTAGCTIPFKIVRFLASLKIMSPSFFRSSDPSGERMSVPNWPIIARRPGVPGATTSRARMSASMTGTERSFRSVETVDLPDAIPPVSPTTIEPLLEFGSLVPRCPDTTKHIRVSCLQSSVWCGSKMLRSIVERYYFSFSASFMPYDVSLFYRHTTCTHAVYLPSPRTSTLQVYTLEIMGRRLIQLLFTSSSNTNATKPSRVRV